MSRCMTCQARISQQYIFLLYGKKFKWPTVGCTKGRSILHHFHISVSGYLNYQNAVTAVLAGKLEPQRCTVETRAAKGNNTNEEIVFAQDTFCFNFAVSTTISLKLWFLFLIAFFGNNSPFARELPRASAGLPRRLVSQFPLGRRFKHILLPQTLPR